MQRYFFRSCEFIIYICIYICVGNYELMIYYRQSTVHHRFDWLMKIIWFDFNLLVGALIFRFYIFYKFNSINTVCLFVLKKMHTNTIFNYLLAITVMSLMPCNMFTSPLTEFLIGEEIKRINIYIVYMYLEVCVYLWS